MHTDALVLHHRATDLNVKFANVFRNLLLAECHFPFGCKLLWDVLRRGDGFLNACVEEGEEGLRQAMAKEKQQP